MDAKSIDQIFLELAEVTSARTPRETRLQKRVVELESVLTSVRAVCQREGLGTLWENLDARLKDLGIGKITSDTFSRA